MDVAGSDPAGLDPAGGPAAPRCPRCTGALIPADRPHGPQTGPRTGQPEGTRWRCRDHGGVVPLQPPSPAGIDAVHELASTSQVPLWLPWPLPPGWTVTGLQHAGDDGAGAVATALTCVGPNPLAISLDASAADADGGSAMDAADARVELVVLAERPGTGWGAAIAGLPRLDPGPATGRPDAKVWAAGRPTPLWNVPAGPGPAVYMGEADGVWLYLITWPAAAGVLLLDEPELVDLRDPGHALPIPFG